MNTSWRDIADQLTDEQIALFVEDEPYGEVSDAGMLKLARHFAAINLEALL